MVTKAVVTKRIYSIAAVPVTAQSQLWPLQVFLTIARKAEVEAAAQEGRSTQPIALPDGAVLNVLLGEEYATVEGTSQQYQVKWAQDEAGNLQVSKAAISHTVVGFCQYSLHELLLLLHVTAKGCWQLEQVLLLKVIQHRALKIYTCLPTESISCFLCRCWSIIQSKIRQVVGRAHTVMVKTYILMQPTAAMGNQGN